MNFNIDPRKRGTFYTIKQRKDSWIGHVLDMNCLLKYVIEGKREGEIEVIGIQGRRRKQLLDTLRKRVDAGIES